MGRYKQKLWLSKHKYLAVLEDALVVVTLNEKGQEVRWAIFEKGENDGNTGTDERSSQV